MLLVADGEVQPFDGDLDDYRKFLLRRQRARRSAPNRAEGANKTTRAATMPQRRRQLKPLKDKLEAAEHQIADLNAEIAKCDKSLADPLLFTQGSGATARPSPRNAPTPHASWQTLEARWLKMQEEYEQAMARDSAAHAVAKFSMRTPSTSRWSRGDWRSRCR